MFVVSNLVWLQNFLVCGQTERYCRKRRAPASHPLLTIQCHRGRCMKFSLYVPEITVRHVAATARHVAASHRIRKTTCRGSRLKFSPHASEITERHVGASPKGDLSLKIYPLNPFKKPNIF